MTAVCLVIPPSIFLLDERVFASLGILKVASSLEAAGHRVEVLDLSGISNYEEVVRIHVASSPSTHYGITATTPQMPAATRVLAAIRSTRPDVRTIIGGPHPTLIAAARRMEARKGLVNRGHAAFDRLTEMFDVVVSGDGELAIHRALTEDGFVDADDPKGPLFLTDATLEETAWPARHLIDLGSYHYDVHGYKATSLISQLGCPMKCFQEDTKIITSNGSNRRAKDVAVGDTLVALDEETKELTETTVTHIFRRDVSELMLLRFEDGRKLEVTEEHPFYVRGEWVMTKDLIIGDEIYGITPGDKLRDATMASLRSFVWNGARIVSIDRIQKQTAVVNFSCSPHENYFANYVLSHNCTFCGGRNSPMLRRIRSRSTQNVVSELEHLYRTYGYRGFMFYDDELNVSKSMIELMDAISDLQERLGVDFRLRGFVKAELFTPEQASAMYRAGFRQLLTGFESGSERILTNIQKQATRDENTRCVETARDAGLRVKALMSVGHAGESLGTIEATRDWLLEVRPDDFDCTVITTYPGTPYYDEAVETGLGIWTYTAKNGDRLHARELDYNITADYYKGAPDGGYAAYVYTDHITSDGLVAARDALERDVRSALAIPFNPSAAAVNYEHSMGQTALPSSILRTSEAKPRVVRLSVIK